ncbi:MAG: alpha/beta hydrolase [Caldilineales bacterium]
MFCQLSQNDLTRRKPPLVLIHGAGGTHRHWPAELRRLPDWTVYALDLPGHGRSGGAGFCTVAAYREAIFGFLEAEGLEKVVLAGHSMGGAVVQDFALHYGGRLAGIVLVGTGAKLRVAPDILTGLLSDFENTARLITDWCHGPAASEQQKRLYLQQLLEESPAVVHGDYLACDAFDLRADLPSIHTPALVVCGSADIMTPPKFGEYLFANLPDAQLRTIPNAGHMMALEAPEEVTGAVESFLQKAL